MVNEGRPNCIFHLQSYCNHIYPIILKLIQPLGVDLFLKSATDICLGLIRPCSYVNASHKNKINFHWVTNVQFISNIISPSRCIYIQYFYSKFLSSIFSKVNRSLVMWGPHLLVCIQFRVMYVWIKQSSRMKICQKEYCFKLNCTPFSPKLERNMLLQKFEMIIINKMIKNARNTKCTLSLQQSF